MKGAGCFRSFLDGRITLKSVKNYKSKIETKNFARTKIKRSIFCRDQKKVDKHYKVRKTSACCILRPRGEARFWALTSDF